MIRLSLVRINRSMVRSKVRPFTLLYTSLIRATITVKNEGDERVSGAPRRRKKDTDQEDYEDMPSEADEPPRRQPTPVNGMGRPRRAAAIKADLNRPRQATRRRRLRSDSEEENESDEPFFLNCEVCKRSGWNQDDSQHLISCQDCGIWQQYALLPFTFGISSG